MSKYVKNLVADHIRNRLTGINDALLVNVIGIESNAAMKLRTELRAKNINLLVVKNSLAARAVAGTPLDGLFEDATGSAAICWGAADIVSLAKEVTRLIRSDAFKPLEPRGGVMDGSRLSAAQIAEVAKWPSRQEQISMVVGQFWAPAAAWQGRFAAPAERWPARSSRRARAKKRARKARKARMPPQRLRKKARVRNPPARRAAMEWARTHGREVCVGVFLSGPLPGSLTVYEKGWRFL